ncbi:MAG: glycosyltransferase family 4 protein [Synechococcales cyanobacterium C42_A2020_086]|nr:glycosyltransferase family 4 protein [Synechococcales cyanobacterium C42_A2020_086]
MRLAYVTTYNPQNVEKWSGLGYYISQALNQHAIPIDFIGPLKEQLAFRCIRSVKRQYYKLRHQRYLHNPEPLILRNYAQQIRQKLSRLKSDIVFSITSRPIPYLECQQPIIFWSDSTFAGLLNFYPHYSNLCQETIQNWHLLEQLALQKSQFAIYASDWAAKTAIDHYGADPERVKVVPFGANLESQQTLEDVKTLIEARPTDYCKLLFLGVDWIRKGGDVAFKVAKALNQAGLPTELTVVGCEPQVDEPLPNYVKSLGFISKSTSAGKEKISRLLADSHFLILPSMAECFGVVFSEASSFGVPSLATQVGGIPTAVRPNINGQLFAPDADIAEYCTYIADLFSNYATYKQLALSSFAEYQTRLNWSVAGQRVKQLLQEM